MASTLDTIANTAARPASGLTAGQTLFQEDINRIIVWDGTSNWREYVSDRETFSGVNADQLSYTGGIWATGGYALGATAPALHLDASILNGADLTGNLAQGESVPTWGDRSGNNVDGGNSTGSTQMMYWLAPVSGYVDHSIYSSVLTKVMYVNGVTSGTSGLGTATDSDTILAVWKKLDSGAGYGYITGDVGGYAAFSYNNSEKLMMWGDTTASARDVYTLPTCSMITRDGSGDSTHYFNGGSAADTANSTTAYTIKQLMWASAGWLYEYIYFTDELSLAELNVVREYLVNKYSFLQDTTPGGVSGQTYFPAIT